MAHFAKIGIDNVVTGVLSMDTITTMTPGGIEREEIGIAHLKEHHGHENWKKCSYNTVNGVHIDPETGEPSADQTKALRANYPGIGWYYSSEHDIFYPPRPTDDDGDLMNSSTLNTTTGQWDHPIAKPALTDDQIANASYYRWDESAYQSDNTQGWVLVTPSE